MSLLDSTVAASFFPKRAIGSFTAYVTIDESATDELEITQHPVQQGAEITDHAYIKPATLSIKAMWSNNEEPVSDIYQKLLDLQASREPFDIVTGKRAYTNMLFKSLGVTTNAETENALSVSASFTQVFITALEVVSVPPRKNQRTPGKTGKTQQAGAKSATPDSTKSVSSLKTLIGL